MWEGVRGGGGTKAELSLAPSAADGLLQSVLLYFSTHFAFHETTMMIVARKGNWQSLSKSEWTY